MKASVGLGAKIDSQGNIPVRWYNWRNLGSYETTNLIDDTWVQVAYTSELPETEDGNQGVHYGSGIMGNASGRAIVGSLVVYAMITTSGVTRNMDIALGFWNGSSYVVDESTLQTISVGSSSATVSNSEERLKFSNVALSATGRYCFFIRRGAVIENLRVHGWTNRFVENDQ